MKTHLPVALRKALITAICAVSFVSYNAHAEEPAQPVSYGDITTPGTVISESGSVSVGTSTDTADELSITTPGDVAIGSIQTAEGEALDKLTVHAGGNLTIGDSGATGSGSGANTSYATITNADIETGGDFIIGETPGSAHIFYICGTEEPDSVVNIAVGGDFVVNQAVSIHPGGGSTESGDLTITSKGNMMFVGQNTTINGGGFGSTATATLTSDTGSILITGAELCNLGEGAKLITLGAGGNVQLLNEEGAHSISGDISSAGKIELEGVYNYIVCVNKKVEYDAAQGIFITTMAAGEIIAYNGITNAVMTAAHHGISITAEAGTYGNDISDSSLTATNDDIIVGGEAATMVSESQFEAGNGDVAVSGTSVTISDDSTMTSTTGDVSITATSGKAEVTGGTVSARQGTASISGATETVLAGVAVEGAVIAVGSGMGSTVIRSDSDTATTLKASGNITVEDTEVLIEEDTVISSDSGDVEISATDDKLEMSGGSVTTDDGDISISGAAGTTITGTELHAAAVSEDTGTVAIGQPGAGKTMLDGASVDAEGQAFVSGNITELKNGASVHGDAGVSISSTVTNGAMGNVISRSSVTTADGDISINAACNIVENASSISAGGDVRMLASELNQVLDSTVTAGGDVSIGAGEGSSATPDNVVAAASAGARIEAVGSVFIQGRNSVYSESAANGRAFVVAEQGDIDVAGDNYIRQATLQAGGAVRITTGEGDMATMVENSTLIGGSVTIAGDATSRDSSNLAVVTGEDMYVTAGSITLNNVSVVDTGADASNIRASEGGSVFIQGRVDMKNATLTASGHIEVGMGHVLNARKGTSLEGGLSGSGDINKSGGDALVLSGDNTAFSGTIYANGAVGGAAGSVVDADNAGTWIEMTGAGVGTASSMVLKNTDLVVNSSDTQMGTLDTTQDSAANNAATGGTLRADGSYTADDGTRTDFTTVGSVLEVHQGSSGDVLRATGMKLSDATLIKLDAEVGADGQVSSDIIKVSGSIDTAAAKTGNSVSPATAPATARVFVAHLGAASSAAEGARTTIMEGTMASAINEDVLYDVVRSDNGTYQRVLQERNVHLENKGDRVDLVYSKNYRSAAKDAQLASVASVLQQMSDNLHHSEGTLAASGDTTARLIDAFDYTRSEAAAVRGLQSVAGFGNVLPRLMQFDSSRHHLRDLRSQMTLPVCARTWKGGENRTNNTWLTYTGAQDDLSGDAYMGDYSRTAHGFLLGADRSITCNLRVGASLGFEKASSSADLSKVDGDTCFLDAYAVAVKGKSSHRVSVGLASSSFDAERGVAVEAGYHSFSGQTKSSTDGFTMNFGYELSDDHQLNARSSLARYLAFNLSWHKLDAMKDDGLGNMGLETSYDDAWQADAALGMQYNREFAAVRYEAPASFFAAAELHLDLLNERVAARNRFLGPESGWEVKSMKRDRFYLELGAGVIVPLSPSWTATAGAAVEVGPEHTSFSGNAGVRYSF